MIHRDATSRRLKVMFLDFDWAGNAGEARYPVQLNQAEWTRLGLPDVAGKLITSDQDIEVLCGDMHLFDIREKASEDPFVSM
jgi:hypothetical protein